MSDVDVPDGRTVRTVGMVARPGLHVEHVVAGGELVLARAAAPPVR